jgi:hypothetical protein
MAVKIAETAKFRYTTMMRSLVATGLLALILAPQVAMAQTYMGPEEVFLRDFKRINSRSARVEVQKQQQTVSTKPTAVPWWEVTAVSSSSAAVEVSSSSAPAAYQGPETAQGQATLDPVTLRWLARLQNRQAQLEAQNQQQTFQHSTALYSGAPLAGTGLASSVVVAAVIGAIGFTLYRVRKARKLLD